MAETVGGRYEQWIAAAEVTPGKYYEGEDANYTGAGERPTIGGIASGKGADNKDIPIIGADDSGQITYGKLVNNDAVTEKPIPRDKEYILGPISEHYQRGQ